MRQTFIFTIICVFCFSSCISYRLTPTLILEDARINNENGIGTINSPAKRFENESIVFVFENSANSFNFLIENKVNSPLLLVLDEASVIDIDGFSYRLISGDTRALFSSLSQVPIPISPNGTVKVNLIMSRQLNGSNVENFFPKVSKSKKRLLNAYNYVIEHENFYKFYLPVKNTVSNEVTQYEFVLKIDGLQAI